MDPECGALAVRRGGWRIDKQQADLGSHGNVETAYNTDGGAPHKCRGRSASKGKITFRNLLKIVYARCIRRRPEFSWIIVDPVVCGPGVPPWNSDAAPELPSPNPFGGAS